MVRTVVPEADIGMLIQQAMDDDPSLASMLSVHCLPDLDNAIHPLFAYERFTDTTIKEYEALTLALRLASLFLTEEALLQWYAHAAYGKTVERPGQEPCLEDQMGPYSQQDLHAVSAALEDLASFVTFKWNSNEGFSLASTTPIVAENATHPTSRHHPLFRTAAQDTTVLMRLNSQWRAYVSGPCSGHSTASLAARLRFAFVLGTTLAHEATHAFGIMLRGDSLEPLFRASDRAAEWGESWEAWVFGARIFPAGKRLAPTPTLLGNAWITRADSRARGGYVRAVVPMRWVAAWFRKETWAALALAAPPAAAVGGVATVGVVAIDEARGRVVPLAKAEIRIWTSVRRMCRLLEPGERTPLKACPSRMIMYDREEKRKKRGREGEADGREPAGPHHHCCKRRRLQCVDE
ncbi:uncharacterized protein K452DRAFT_360425 [Aplosporella prunicola CBS 121167]|uniref:Uncharacterized protein n=1 Tax=Aplosporella prunicola CBS 121167 TaxID=1176127 RepID=A0A6A6B730_9PEZI|nr:uncharacterized protein K452DRAFT_360425 [Aplosporella prunicola CBS 121167]KAF2139696.1 hypothetical protein K452DRAFT_360425 [Aplosporella prunicola CBS 121167]